MEVQTFTRLFPAKIRMGVLCLSLVFKVIIIDHWHWKKKAVKHTCANLDLYFELKQVLTEKDSTS